MLYLPIVQYMAETTTIDRLAAMATDNEPLSEAALKRIEEALVSRQY